MVSIGVYRATMNREDIASLHGDSLLLGLREVELQGRSGGVGTKIYQGITGNSSGEI